MEQAWVCADLNRITSNSAVFFNDMAGRSGLRAFVNC